MKKFLIVIGIVVFSLVFIVIFSNHVIKTAVTVVASKITGAPVHIDSFSLNILSSTVHISGFKMYNPTGFPKGVLISCPKIKVIYDRATLFKQKRHFLIVEIELKEMVLVKNKEGKLNVDSLKISQQSKPSSPIPMQIDLLSLSIGKIVYKDYTIGTKPRVQVYYVNMQKSYKGIPTVQQLALLVFAEPMKATAIKGAEIYGVVMLTGVGALPVLAAATFIGKDSVKEIINASFERVYEVSLEEIKRIGKITAHDASSGVIKADINGAMVKLILNKGAGNKTEITISARKYMLPSLDIAGWVLYQIIDTLQIDIIQ